ncbi:MAG TPA: Fe2+-dependent dioxygenase [Rhizomicrobium sp.]|jgi:PKHD-type hydroxylase|nr:Fe2+-dependent dioxygenase [Rhizomicrobium sp.]
MTTIIENVLTKDEVREFRGLLDKTVWPDAQAVGTAGSLARLVKNNQQLDEGAPLAIDLGNRILRKLAKHDQFTAYAHPRLIYPPRFNRYSDGGSYGFHSDSALLHVANSSVVVRSDISVTLFLSEPDEYEGGELEIETASDVQAVKLGAGDMVLYPSGALHRVLPVTKGARIASFFWIQSMVRDAGERALLYDLDQSVQQATSAMGGQNPTVQQLAAVYHNLLRRWADT